MLVWEPMLHMFIGAELALPCSLASQRCSPHCALEAAVANPQQPDGHGSSSWVPFRISDTSEF